MAFDVSELSSREERFGEVVFAFLRARERGETPDPADWLARHPEFATELADFFGDQHEVDGVAAALREVAEAASGGATDDPDATEADTPDAQADAPLASFGDYEVLGELAHGGMGVVYKARQRSLNRPVALKVIRAGELASAEDARRFRMEAETVALLDDPHVVPVHEVGEHAGRLFFSMKLVEGGSLAGQLDRFRHDLKGAAQMMATVARAVHHAHQRGILHRDLKPSNILLDDAGRPYVTDFGLAKRVETDSGLTRSGAVVGTPSYMAPEQASGKSGQVTTVTDVYGLGAVLYALLAGRPPFQADSVLETLEQVRQREPQPPSGLRRGVDRELETVCLKCLEKEPGRRYGSAEELAQDLERWLNHEPVHARRTRWPRRLAKWVRRRPTTAALMAVVVATTVLAGGTGLWWLDKRVRLEGAVKPAYEESVRLHGEGKLPEALSAARRADGLLAGGAVREHLAKGVREWLADLEMAARLEEIRGRLRADVQGGHFDYAGADRAYGAAFRAYGIDVEFLPVAEAAQRIATRPIRVELTAALDDWAAACTGYGTAGHQRWKDLLALAGAADGDKMRARVRAAVVRGNRLTLTRLATAASADGLPVPTAVILAGALSELGAVPDALALLRRVQILHPGDFWVNFELAMTCGRMQPPLREEQIRFATAAWALRPDNAAALNNLGNALREHGQLNEGIAALRAAIRLNDDFAGAHNNLAIALHDAGRLDEAIAELRRAIKLSPAAATPRCNLGADLSEKGELGEAVAELRRAIELDPRFTAAHCNLGDALKQQGRLHQAVASYREAIRLDKDCANAHDHLANALRDAGRLEEALAEHRKAIRLERNNAAFHSNLGATFFAKHSLEMAIAEYGEAIRLNKNLPEAHDNLGAALAAKGRVDEAIASFREAIRLKPNFALAHCNLGGALVIKGQLNEALDVLRAAIRMDSRDPEAHHNMGLALFKSGRLDEAISEFRRAIRLSSGHAKAHGCLGAALSGKGRTDEAIREWREAIRLKPDYPEAHYGLGNGLRDSGRTDQAIAEYRAAIRLQEDYPEAHTNLGIALLAKGCLDDAIDQYRMATASREKFPEAYKAHCRLGMALHQKGRLNEAVAAYREAIRMKRDLPEALCDLGLALLELGQFQEAVTALRRGHQIGSRDPEWSNPSAQWLREAEDMARLDARLPALLKGDVKPGDAAERLALAKLCQEHRQLHAAAARWYAEAFAAQPQLADDLHQPHRYNAVCAAALAGCGRGKDQPRLDEGQRRAWRNQALDWLRADLAACEKTVAAGSAVARAEVRRRLELWQRDPDLVAVRGAALESLPAAERDGWRKLWADAGRLLARTQSGRKAAARAGTKEK
jgi:tetratricopeptide (TPR) repeat protein/tRNA A-37 threonylcarbamoyl transferase component Bud32